MGRRLRWVDFLTVNAYWLGINHVGYHHVPRSMGWYWAGCSTAWGFIKRANGQMRLTPCDQVLAIW